MKNIISILILLGIVAVSVFGIFGNIQAKTINQENPYPLPGCNSLGTFPGERTKVQFPVPPGFLVCHVWVRAMDKTWQFDEDGCKIVDGFGRELCVTGIGTNRAWIITDGSFKFTNFAVFAWALNHLPIVQNGYP